MAFFAVDDSRSTASGVPVAGPSSYLEVDARGDLRSRVSIAEASRTQVAKEVIMVTLMFDTHAFIQRLKSSGFDEPQAEALSSAIKEVYDTAWHEIATKHDVADLNAKIDAVAAATKHDMVELNAKIDAVAAATKHDMAELNVKIDAVSTELNTKIDAVSTELNHGLQAVQLRVDARFETLKGEINLLKWMGGVVLAALVSLVLKAFFLSG